jgi:hypothetical protein
LTALALGFLVFQNRTVNQEEIETIAGQSPEAQKYRSNGDGNRMPASESTKPTDSAN